MRVGLMLVNNRDDEHRNAPIGLGYIASALRDAGHEPVAMAQGDATAVDALGISAASQDYEEAVAVARRFQARGVRVCIGGAHANAGARFWEPGIDHLPGMGELTFPAWLEGRAPRTIKHIDELPYPDRDFGRSLRQRPYIMTSRGCAFRCSYCVNRQLEAGIKYHSAERVFREIHGMAADGHRRITIWDDLWAGSVTRLEELARLKNDHVLTAGVVLAGSMGAKIANKRTLDALIALRCFRAGIGAEHAVDRILHQLKGPQFSRAENEAALKRMRDYGMNPGSGFIFGHPDEREEDVVATYEWIMRGYDERWLHNHVVNALCPLPGTPVWDDAERRGLLPTDFKWTMLRNVALNYGLFRNVGEWTAARARDRSIYLNAHNVPWDTLVEIIEHYEGRILRGAYGRLRNRPRNVARAAVRRARLYQGMVREYLNRRS